MKRIFKSLFIVLTLSGCIDQTAIIPEPEPPMTESGNTSIESYTTHLTVSAAHSGDTKVFDEDLKWSWQETDKIYGYQVAGEKHVNVLTMADGNVFSCPEFTYTTCEPSTVHFVYAGDAGIDDDGNGDRGIKQKSRQSGKWSPVLVGSCSEVILPNGSEDEMIVTMQHLSSALEVRLWKENVDKQNLTDADKKNIVYAELYSDTEDILLDIVPDFNTDGSVTYSVMGFNEEEHAGSHIRTEDVNSPVVVFNLAPNEEGYADGDLYLALIDEDGDRYVKALPAIDFVAGKRTILNVEWKTPSSVYLPDGLTFKGIVNDFLRANSGITTIKFITNSSVTSEHALVENSVYLIKNNDVLEIHTSSDQFVAHEDCSSMFYFLNR